MTPEESRDYIAKLSKAHREDILRGHGGMWAEELPIADAIQRADDEERVFSSESIIGASPVDELVSYVFDTNESPANREPFAPEDKPRQPVIDPEWAAFGRDMPFMMMNVSDPFSDQPSDPQQVAPKPYAYETTIKTGEQRERDPPPAIKPQQAPTNQPILIGESQPLNPGFEWPETDTAISPQAESKSDTASPFVVTASAPSQPIQGFEPTKRFATLQNNPFSTPVAKVAPPNSTATPQLQQTATQQAAASLHDALSINNTPPGSATFAQQQQPKTATKPSAASTPQPTSPFPFLKNGVNLSFDPQAKPSEFTGETIGMGDVATIASEMADETDAVAESLMYVFDRIVTTLQNLKRQLDCITEVLDRSNGG